MYSDPSGHMAITTVAILIGVLIGAGIGAIAATLVPFARAVAAAVCVVLIDIFN